MVFLSHVANQGQNEPRYHRNEQEKKAANGTSDVFVLLIHDCFVFSLVFLLEAGRECVWLIYRV